MARLLYTLTSEVQGGQPRTEWPKDDTPSVWWELLYPNPSYWKEFELLSAQRWWRGTKTKTKTSAPRLGAQEWVSRLPRRKAPIP